MKVIVYPGSFDPITKGHIDIIKRARKTFKGYMIHVVIANNRDKNHIFPIGERVEMVRDIFKKEKNIKVTAYSGIISDYLNKYKVDILLRGIRNSVDLNYEMNIEQFTTKTTNTQTIYLTTKPKYSFTSSSSVRTFIKFNQFRNSKSMLDKRTYKYIKRKFCKN